MNHLPKSILSFPTSIFSYRNGDWKLKVPELELFPSNVILLIGDNMVGKSTVLRALAGQEIASNDPALTSIRNVKTVLSAADDPMFRDWSIKDNVFVVSNCRLCRNHVDILKSYLARINEQCNWNIKENVPLHNYSTGARSFIQLARAVVFKPPVYLIDEITPNLDPSRISFFIQVLHELVEGGMALIIVSHSDKDRKLLQDTFSSHQTNTWTIKRNAVKDEHIEYTLITQ